MRLVLNVIPMLPAEFSAIHQASRSKLSSGLFATALSRELDTFYIGLTTRSGGGGSSPEKEPYLLACTTGLILQRCRNINLALRAQFPSELKDSLSRIVLPVTMDYLRNTANVEILRSALQQLEGVKSRPRNLESLRADLRALMDALELGMGKKAVAVDSVDSWKNVKPWSVAGKSFFFF